MKIKITSIVCLLVILVVAQSSSLQAAPTLTVTIEKPLNPPSGTPVSYDVSNMGWLVMDVVIDTKGGATAEGNVPINPTGTIPPSYLVITAANSSGTSVPIHAQITGGLGGRGGYGITFFLPEDATTRTTKEQAFIDHAKATDTTSSAAATAYVNANNTQALAAIDRIYTQSQVGAFTITVSYVSTQSGLWNGTVTGTSIVANVLNEGSLLDNLH